MRTNLYQLFLFFLRGVRLSLSTRVRANQTVSLQADGGELISVSRICSVDLRTSVSRGLAIKSSLLQFTGEPMSEERSPGFSRVPCTVLVDKGKFML